MAKKPKIITISGKAGSGKDTFANLLASQIKGYWNEKSLRIAYADYLKYICKQHFNWGGSKDGAGRGLLQMIGTDIARENNKDIWVNIVIELIKGIGSVYDYVIISDCRFPNEINRWEEEGYEVIKICIQRNHIKDIKDHTLTEDQKKHPSETSMGDIIFDCVYENNGDIFDLSRRVSEFINNIL